MKITNTQDIPLPMAIWLLTDEYDYINDPDYISVTTLMKPLKQIVLAKRVPQENKSFDLSDLIASRLGTALHDSMEKAINTNMPKALRMLGYPQEVIDRVLVNPTPEQVSLVQEPIILWTEQRTVKEVGKWKVGGKYDLVAEGVVQDNKSTSAYTWVYGGRDDDHRRQLSIYKWLNPEVITEDYGVINYIFTDWKKGDAKTNPKYPQSRLVSKNLDLTPPEEIHKWIESKLEQLARFMDKPESHMPECTAEDLWMSDPTFKYYADPAKTSGRSTKNFESLAEANMHRATTGKGIVITTLGQPKRCGYCPAFEVCEQKNRYEHGK